MLTYFLQVNLCWLLFYGLYYVLLSKETFFTLNRIYLIISLLAGLLLPLSADWLRTETPLFIAVPMDSIMLPEFVVGMKEKAVLLPQNTEGGMSLTWWMLLVALYQLGVTLMAIRFGYGIYHIYKIFKTTIIEEENGFLLAHTVVHPDISGKGVLPQPFSFFNVIFIDKNNYQGIDYQNIMQHEKAHARQWHSLDVVFLELLKIVFWYSPMVYLYRHSLKNIHEYLADAAVLRSVSKKQYGTLLIQQAQSANVLALVNPFFSQLKKRIVMMTRNPSKRRSLVKYTFAVPVFLLLVSFLASPNNAVMVNTATVSQEVTHTIKTIPTSNTRAETVIPTIDNTPNQTFKVTLAGLEKGSIDVEIARQQTQFRLFQPNKSICDVQSCLISKQLADGTLTAPIKNTGSTFKPDVRALMQSLQNGERLFINTIKVRCPGDVQAQDYGQMVFDIVDAHLTQSIGSNNTVNMADTTKRDPIFTFANGHTQGFISVQEMKTHKEIVGMELMKKPNNKCEILSFTLTKTSANGIVEKADNETGKFNSNVLKLINSAKVGDEFVFSKVKMRNTDNTILEPAETHFSINSENGETKYNINLSDKPIPRVGTPNSEGIYTIVDEQPEFPQGQKAMFTWLSQNMKYPSVSRENGVQGTVYVGFVVETDGTIANVAVKRGVKGIIRDTITLMEVNGVKGNKIVQREDYSLDNEAKRVISAMPKWKAGRNQGQPVRVAYTLPIKFKLE